MSLEAAAKQARELFEKLVGATNESLTPALVLRQVSQLMAKSSRVQLEFFTLLSWSRDHRLIDAVTACESCPFETEQNFALRSAAQANNSYLVERLLRNSRVRDLLRPQYTRKKPPANKPLAVMPFVVKPLVIKLAPLNYAPGRDGGEYELRSILAVLVYNVARDDTLTDTLGVLLNDTLATQLEQVPIAACAGVATREPGANYALLCSMPQLITHSVNHAARSLASYFATSPAERQQTEAIYRLFYLHLDAEEEAAKEAARKRGTKRSLSDADCNGSATKK